MKSILHLLSQEAFQRFIRMCAGRAGRAAQLLDFSGLDGDVEISHNTARDWFGVLEAGFIAFRLEPYFRNFSKRLIKSPKLYFYDTGLFDSGVVYGDKDTQTRSTGKFWGWQDYATQLDGFIG